MGARVGFFSPHVHSLHVQQLRLLGLALAVTPLFALAFSVGALLLERRDLAVAAGLALVMTLIMYASRRLALRGRRKASALTLGYGLLALPMVFVFTLPGLYPFLSLTCVLAVAMVLPYVSGRSLGLFSLAAMAVVLEVMLVGRLRPPALPLPGPYGSLLLVSITAITMVLICMLLLQFSAQLRGQLAAIRHSEARLRALVEATSQVVWRTDAQGQCSEGCPGWQELTGWPTEQAKADPLGWLMAIHPEDRQRTLERWRQALAGREPYELETRVVHPKGLIIPLLIRGVPVRDETGAVREWIGTCTDITERKTAEDMLHFLTEASAQLASSLDHATTLACVSRLALPRLADWSLLELTSGKGEARHRPQLAHVAPAREQAGLALLAHGEGERLLQSLPVGQPALLRPERGAPAGAGSPGGLLEALGAGSVLVLPLVARGRPLGTLALGRMADTPPFSPRDVGLAQELIRRAALALDNARLFQEAQQAIHSRDEFLSIASHELRTPLTPLQLKLHALRRQAGPRSAEPGFAAWLDEQCVLLQRQARRLTRLVDEMLDISRLAGGRLRLELEPVDLGRVTREVVERLKEEGEVARSGSSLHLEMAGEVTGQWDRLRLEQVVTNLLTNALKYGQGHPIRVEVLQEGEVAWLRVADRGIGIAPEDQERVFGRFERAVSVRHFGGFGLGLYITRQIVEALGGTIRLHSQLGEGTTLTVSLPLAGPASVAAPSLTGAQGNERPASAGWKRDAG